MYTIIKKIRNFINRILVVGLEKEISCPKIRFGSLYGGWTICPTNINHESIVYSFGIGDDITFDLELIKKYNLKINAFDPTPRSIQWLEAQSLPPKFIYYNWGLSDRDEIALFYPPSNPNFISFSTEYNPKTSHNAIEVRFYCLKTILNLIGDSKIDILKIDVEGEEYRVLDDVLKNSIKVSQILVEFHYQYKLNKILKTRGIIKKLKRRGYKFFDISETVTEFSFIKLSN